MHAVLGNDDFLHIICGFLHQSDQRARLGDLLAFALVHRIISDVALDFIWKRVHIGAIYSLFPAEIVFTNPEGKKSFIRRPVTLEHWSRFDQYAPRIRSLTSSFLSETQADLCAALARHPSLRHPFPNLTSLEWLSDVSLAWDGTVLFCPTLKNVSCAFDGDGRDDVGVDVLQTLKEACPRLQELHYTDCSLWNSTALEESLISIAHHFPFLVEAGVPTSHRILKELGRLASLRSLELYNASWENRRQMPTNGFDSRQDDRSEEATFVALENLAVEAPPSLRTLTQRLQSTGCFPRKSFRMWIENADPWQSEELVEFLPVILHPVFSAELHRFSIKRTPTITGMNHPRDTWAAFGPLLSLRHLREFTADGFLLDMDDSDLQKMVQAWPELRILNLNNSYKPEHYQSQITFQGLVHLSTLPKLRQLSVTLSLTSDIPSSILSVTPSSTSPLTTIEFGPGFPSASIFQITLFLAKFFPNLKNIHTLDGDPVTIAKWCEVESGLDIARQALHGKSSKLQLV